MKCSDLVMTRWQQLMKKANEKQQVVMSSYNFFKTSEKVSDFLFLFGYLYSVFLPEMSVSFTPTTEPFFYIFLTRGLSKRSFWNEHNNWSKSFLFLFGCWSTTFGHNHLYRDEFSDSANSATLHAYSTSSSAEVVTKLYETESTTHAQPSRVHEGHALETCFPYQCSVSH